METWEKWRFTSTPYSKDETSRHLMNFHTVTVTAGLKNMILWYFMKSCDYIVRARFKVSCVAYTVPCKNITCPFKAWQFWGEKLMFHRTLCLSVKQISVLPCRFELSFLVFVPATPLTCSLEWWSCDCRMGWTSPTSKDKVIQPVSLSISLLSPTSDFTLLVFLPSRWAADGPGEGQQGGGDLCHRAPRLGQRLQDHQQSEHPTHHQRSQHDSHLHKSIL